MYMKIGHKRGGFRIPIGIKRPANLLTIGRKAAKFADVGLRKTINTMNTLTPIALAAGAATGMGTGAAGAMVGAKTLAQELRQGVTRPLRSALGD